MYLSLIAGGAVAIALIAVLAVVANTLRPSVDLGTRLPDEGRTHVPDTTTPQYRTYPPASGPHYDAPAAWGSIDATLPEGRYVHNLEHGGIAILYKCPDNCDAVKASVAQVYNQIPAESQFHEVKVVATPYTRMDHPFAVLAWDYVHEMDTLDAQYVRQFYDAHVNKGPEVIP